MARKTTPKATPMKTVPTKAAPVEVGETPMLKKPELFEEVVARTSLKKRDVKPAVETAMAVIADALRDGKDVNLPPLGKLRVVKSKDLENGAAVITLKLRTPRNATMAAATDQSADKA